MIKENISEQEVINFNTRFGISHGFDCSVRENVWRRHQTEENAELSGWQNSCDRRIRLVHFRDKYAIVDNNFCLIDNYLYIHLSLPDHECKKYLDILKQTKTRYTTTPDGNYVKLDIYYGSEQPEQILRKPWEIFKTGIRQKMRAGCPTRILPEDLKDFFPAHLELGCGPSIEAGIPPLNYFHDIFSISKDGKFVFREEDDKLVRALLNPYDWYEKTTYMQKRCLEANPTPFYHRIKSLLDSGDIIGPVFNNNFDGLIKSVGVEEICLRKWDETGLYPKYPFSKNAKSLIVVGSHADRRECQKHARDAGLKIVYIDPEGYNKDGTFMPYPLEAPQDQDFVINLSAKEAFNHVNARKKTKTTPTF